jgi:hypothetical protein
MIQRQWEAIGLTIELVPYDASEPIGRSENIDFWYVECQIREPLVDAGRIFSPAGFVGHASPHMLMALRQLKEANNWREVSERLRELHRIAFDETTVLPLWQMTEYYAFRKGTGGVGASHVTLYQNIEQWRIPFYLP